MKTQTKIFPHALTNGRAHPPAAKTTALAKVASRSPVIAGAKDPSRLLKQLLGPVRRLAARAKALTIRGKEDLAEGGDLLKKLGETRRSIVAQKKQFTEPLKEHVREIEADFDPLIDAVDAGIESLKPRVEAAAGRALVKVEEKVAEETKRIEKNHGAACARAERSGRDLPPPPAAPVAVPVVDVGAATIRKVLDVEVVDWAKVPARFLELKKGEALDAHRDGMEMIPGLRFFRKAVAGS